jgi:anaerobic selenocysteine-containing dehydrogenase
MTSLTALLSKWPLIRQIRERADGTAMEAMSDKTRAMHARTHDAQVARSICPYCGVGCGQLIYHTNGKLFTNDLSEEVVAIRSSAASENPTDAS